MSSDGDASSDDREVLFAKATAVATITNAMADTFQLHLQDEKVWGEKIWRASLVREGTCWQHIVQTLVCYRLIDPGSEWRLHRQWFEQSAMADLLGGDLALAEKNALYRCLDKLLPHKEVLFWHLRQRWQDLFGARFDVLLYDLTST